jgi:hypothetical protein
MTGAQIPGHRRKFTTISVAIILESMSAKMRSLVRIFPIVLIFLGALLLFERPAYAYADPGSGLLAIQAAGSALVATGWYLRRKIYALFHRDSAESKTDESANVVNREDSPQL